MSNKAINVIFAEEQHAVYAERICQLIYESALQRGTGIAKRSPDYIAAKIAEGKATKTEYAAQIAERQTWRDDINAARDEIARLEDIEPDPDEKENPEP